MDQSPNDEAAARRESLRDSLICFWCVHSLPQLPCIHLPIRYDDRTKVFGTIGNFCSWPCAKAYANDMGTARSGEIQSFLALMRKQALGKYTPLWPAPKREALACFGGTMTIEEFRGYGGHVEPPRVHYPFEKMYIVEIGTAGGGTTAGSSATAGIIQGSKGGGRLKAIENSSAEGDTLRLKRNKPLVRAESKLESALGIKRREPALAPSS